MSSGSSKSKGRWGWYGGVVVEIGKQNQEDFNQTLWKQVLRLDSLRDTNFVLGFLNG